MVNRVVINLDGSSPSVEPYVQQRFVRRPLTKVLSTAAAEDEEEEQDVVYASAHVGKFDQ